MRTMQIKNILPFIDAILLTLIGISLIEIHMVLSCMALIISIVYTCFKFTYFLIEKFYPKNEDEKFYPKNEDEKNI